MARSPRPLTTTAAPSSASASAIALPIFLPAPVTIATLPDSARAPAIAASRSPQNARPKSQAQKSLLIVSSRAAHGQPSSAPAPSGSRNAIRDRALKRFKLRRRNRPPTVGAELQRDPDRCTPLEYRLPSRRTRYSTVPRSRRQTTATRRRSAVIRSAKSAVLPRGARDCPTGSPRVSRPPDTGWRLSLPPPPTSRRFCSKSEPAGFRPFHSMRPSSPGHGSGSDRACCPSHCLRSRRRISGRRRATTSRSPRSICRPSRRLSFSR